MLFRPNQRTVNSREPAFFFLRKRKEGRKEENLGRQKMYLISSV
jgi:hypothetical protein